ncbi:NAD(P)-binding protein [Paramyrothecium foliicola]|nr:NAD(P)-binding protein [Paramyrothecium foliicola]
MAIIAVAGGTGQVGRAVVDGLVAHGHTVYVLSRASRAIDGTKSLPVDYEDYTKTAKVLQNAKVDTLICAIGVVSSEANRSQLNLIQAANMSTTTNRFVIASFDMKHQRKHISTNPLARYTFEAIEALEKTSLQYTRIVNGWFIDYYGMPHWKTYLHPWINILSMENKWAAIPGDGSAKATFITTQDMSRFVAHLMDAPEWDKESCIVGNEMSFNDLLRSAEEARGCKFEVAYNPLEQLDSGKISFSDRFPKIGFPGPGGDEGFFARIHYLAGSGDYVVQTEKPLNDQFPDIKLTTVNHVMETVVHPTVQGHAMIGYKVLHHIARRRARQLGVEEPPKVVDLTPSNDSPAPPAPPSPPPPPEPKAIGPPLTGEPGCFSGDEAGSSGTDVTGIRTKNLNEIDSNKNYDAGSSDCKSSGETTDSSGSVVSKWCVLFQFDNTAVVLAVKDSHFGGSPNTNKDVVSGSVVRRVLEYTNKQCYLGFNTAVAILGGAIDASQSYNSVCVLNAAHPEKCTINMDVFTKTQSIGMTSLIKKIFLRKKQPPLTCAIAFDDAGNTVMDDPHHQHTASCFVAFDPLAVVELFQSQSCEACPPAIPLLHSGTSKPNTLLLTYNVTIFDHLGWKDTFACPAWDQRQRAYVRKWGRNSIFTPQVVINGLADNNNASESGNIQEVESTARNVLQQLGWNIHVHVNDTDIRIDSDKLDPEPHDILVVTYKDGDDKIKIGKGPNKGKKLVHRNVVAGVIKAGEWQGGNLTVPLPPLSSAKRLGQKAAVLVQQGGNGGAIVAAARL